MRVTTQCIATGGVYLSIIMEFLLEILKEKPQIVGLSATIPAEDKELVKNFVKAEEIVEIKIIDRKPRFLLSEAIQFHMNENSLCEAIVELLH